MLPPQEGPEPGSIACVFRAYAQSRANTTVALLHIFSIINGNVVDATTTVAEEKSREEEGPRARGGGLLEVDEGGR